MGLLDNTTQQAYYQGNNYGNYQFTSLEDIINQFIIAYTGENKIIPKVKRTDVAFHAQRAMQELSFDTFKSIKAYEIVLPPSNTMILPHDYVNYTRVMWSDGAGIKHPLYPTRDTQNPFKISQDEDSNYYFGPIIGDELLLNPEFDTGLTHWNISQGIQYAPDGSAIDISNIGGDKVLTFTQPDQNIGITTEAFAVWQAIDVSGLEEVIIKGTKTSSTNATTTRLGIHSVLQTQWNNTDPTGINNDLPDLGSVEWVVSEGGEKSTTIDVTGLATVYVLITSFPDSNSTGWASIDYIDSISVTSNTVLDNLSIAQSSTTWDNYSSNTSSSTSDANAHNYDTDIYDFNLGQRYGLDPQHAQANGSFYIDNLRGLINFSSNCSGKTIVLDYISDSLGTDGEMQVHKFAEEAMYKSIAYAICSTTIAGQQLVPRFKKEKFAAIRQAKLRLSNIKLEEITQILRGKSKWIKS